MAWPSTYQLHVLYYYPRVHGLHYSVFLKFVRFLYISTGVHLKKIIKNLFNRQKYLQSSGQYFFSSNVCRFSNQIVTSNLGENGLQFYVWFFSGYSLRPLSFHKLNKEFEHVCPKLEEVSSLSKSTLLQFFNRGLFVNFH